MVGQQNGIRVTVRFRPMNQREKSEDNNGVCVKVSDCHTAAQIHNAKVDRNSNFFFDKVYPPGVSQVDVYKYTGRPLVDACLDGYNSTLFAYGQTGSGKTFSMMGVLNTEMRGIQPRVIEDLFDHIDNLPADCTDEYQVQISMCEIYLERVKDLFNPIQDNLKVREDQDKNIYIEHVTELKCESAQEVLDSMDTGFMNRATSATKMNAESSRSHCITILKVTKTTANGSKQVSKIKMVDLAGSEKTTKTGATGERLKEANTINSSLTALSKVLKALSDGAKFIPYRDSKLTRLLQDALGGNSKTSLIVAASPCAFNCEETISSMRFGERAKKVKTNAVININMSADEYKKRCAVLEKENETLKIENELYRLKETEVQTWMGAKNFDYHDIVKAVKMAGGEEQKSAEGMNFSQVSSQMFEVNKKTGKISGGSAFSVSMNTKSEKLQSLAKQKAENERIANLAFACIMRGDYEQVGNILQGKCQIEGGASSSTVQRLEDDIADLKAELKGAEQLADQAQDEMYAVHDRMDRQSHDISKLQAQIAEHRFYKQKVTFLEKEHEMTLKAVKMNPHMEDAGDVQSEFDLSFADGCSPTVQAAIEKLAKSAAKNASLVKRMKGEKSLNMEDLMEALQGNDKAAAFKQILKAQMATTEKFAESEKRNEKLKRAVTMLSTKEAHWRDLQANWKQQLGQMEQAVLLCSSIQKRDRNKFSNELKNKDEEVQRLKSYVQKLQANANRAQPTKSSRFGVRSKVQKKRRPAKVQPKRRSSSEERVAREGVSA